MGGVMICRLAFILYRGLKAKIIFLLFYRPCPSAPAKTSYIASFGGNKSSRKKAASSDRLANPVFW